MMVPLRRSRHALAVSSLALLLALLSPRPLRAAEPGAWTGTGRPVVPLSGSYSLTPLADGRVLVAGGVVTSEGGRPARHAQLYDPATGTWSATGSMMASRWGHTATLLADGRVLAVGGMAEVGEQLGPLASAEVYDPATGAWSPTGDLATPRSGHALARLADGRVLVTGGSLGGTRLASAELYDPATGAWSAAAPMLTARVSHAMASLPDGTVLVTGGIGLTDAPIPTEVYDSATDHWRATDSLSTGTISLTFTLTPLADGRVLAGAQGCIGFYLYDPATGTWSASTWPFRSCFGGYTMTVLPSGHVLLAGGGQKGPEPIAYLYNPLSELSAPTGRMGSPRAGHQAVLLRTGQVLVAGGNAAGDAELYEPPRDPLPPPGSLEARCRHFSPTGYATCGLFRRHWEEHGGLPQFGYPISPRFEEHNPDDGRGYTVQYFERARFEYHPENPPEHQVLLGLLGRVVTRGREGEPPFRRLPDPRDGSWFPETGHTLRLSFRAHWEQTGGLAVYGYPISEEFDERNPQDGRVYTVQYFERNRFEYHPEHQGTEFEVLLGHLGRQVYGQR